MQIAERKLCNQKFDVCAQIKCQWQMKELVKFAGAGFYATPAHVNWGSINWEGEGLFSFYIISKVTNTMVISSLSFLKNIQKKNENTF